jgi:hypothetical protein
MNGRHHVWRTTWPKHGNQSISLDGNDVGKGGQGTITVKTYYSEHKIACLPL